VEAECLTSVTRICDTAADLRTFFPIYVGATGILLKKHVVGNTKYFALRIKLLHYSFFVYVSLFVTENHMAEH